MISTAANSNVNLGSRTKNIRVSVARNADDMQRCVAIRGAVWLNVPGAKYDEQFGENDYSCTHLLAWCDDEPVGTLRLRWMEGEARFERLSVREEFRSFPLLRKIIDTAMALISAKGYRHASGLTRESALRFWQRRGATVVGEPFMYHDEPLIPIRIVLGMPAHPALSLGPGHRDYEQAMLSPESVFLKEAA